VTDPVVIYHDKCPDGLAAAWAAFTVYGDLATYVPASYGDAPPPIAREDGTARDVIVVDFSYPRDVLLRLHSEAHSLLVLDHHKTAQEALAGLDFCVFDMERSGAGLAWDVLRPGVPRSWVIDYAEDRDLWRHHLPDTHAVNAWLRAGPRTIDNIARAAAAPIEAAIVGGAQILAEERVYIEGVKARAGLAVLAGYVVPAVECPPHCVSEIVGELAEGHHFAAAWEFRDGAFRYSLRSRGDGLDVSAIAKGFGGGGHKHAAGFATPAAVHTSAEGAREVTP
jgi:nanoRNase/pAp phosphatase (c-di-AMP/oligoRNAs hydrolase)